MLMHPYIAKRIVKSHIDDLHRAAGSPPPVRTATEDQLRTPDARPAPLTKRPALRPKPTLAQASEPCT
jgi:hypothetical protein